MRAYVTGATGFLGRAVCRRLAEEGVEVVDLGRRAAATCAGHIDLDLGDLCSPIALASAPPPDVVVHLGARIGWPNVPLADLFRPNVLATGVLSDLAHGWGARLVFASAAIVHGAAAERIEAGSPIDADTDYGKSKLLGEELVRASDAPHSILRLGGIFGAGGPGHLGINRAIDGAMRGTVPSVNAAASARRSYIHVEDAADVVARAAAGDLDGTHLVAGPARSIQEMAQAICDVYLPGSQPRPEPGGLARDQVVVPGAAVPRVRSFEDALAAAAKP